MPAHQNILTFHGCKSGTYVKKYSGKESERTYFQLEFAMRGELFDYLIGCGPFPEPIARFFFREIISAIDHIHSNGISHRDIKPENIFIAGDYHVKVADFGFSIAITGRDGSGLLRTYKGTRPYMAPELAARMEYTGVAVDLFAAGIICFIMVTGRPPFMRAEPNNPHYMPIIDGNWQRFWSLHRMKISPEFMEFIQGMLAYRPADRMDMNAVKNCPWLNGPTATFEEAASLLTRVSPIDLVIPGAQDFIAGQNKDLDTMGELSIQDLNRATSRNCGKMTQPNQTSFYSGSNPDNIFNIIESTITGSLEGTVTQDPEKYRLKASVLQDVEEIEFEINCGIIDQKYCFEFIRTAGNPLDFHSVFTAIVDELKTANS